MAAPAPATLSPGFHALPPEQSACQFAGILFSEAQKSVMMGTWLTEMVAPPLALKKVDTIALEIH